VLSRSVSYANLSGAATHVGLSQPQLSRIVRRLEDQLKVTLLDRRVRKLAAWTPQARQLARLWARNLQVFEAEVRSLGEPVWPKHLRVGTESGLVPTASEFAHFLFERFGVEKIEFDVLEPEELEGGCLSGDLHFICVSRESRRRVSKFTRRLGWQILAPAGETAGVRVLARSEPRETEVGERIRRSRGQDPIFRTIVSDSFEVRKHWIEDRGAGGWMPVGLKTRGSASKHKRPVLLLGSRAVDPRLWDIVASDFHL